MQVNGPLFFISVQSLIKTYSDASRHEVLIVDINNITTIDLSGVYALEDLIKTALSKNIKVLVLDVNSNIKEKLKKMNFSNYIGKENYIESRQSISSFILDHYKVDK